LHVKVKGKVNNLGQTTRIIEDEKGGKVGIASKTKFQKRTLKYLTKRYLKKHQLRDWLRVVNHPDPNHKNEYLLKYYSIYTGDEQEGEQ
jgi:large subunit ribosomal protein L22e